MAESRRRRGGGTAADMLRSLLVVGGFTLVVLLLAPTRQLILPRGSDAQPVKVVSYAQEAAAARRLAGAAALLPAGLPAGWRATSVRFAPRGPAYQLHIGFVTPRQAYAALEEATSGGAAFVVDQLGRAPAVLAPVEVGGVVWQQRRRASGELALIRTAGPTTVVVTGSAGLAELSRLAASLR